MSAIHQQASISLYKQLQNQNLRMAQQLTTAMAKTNQAIQKDGDGDHGVEPGKGQHVNVRA